MPDEHGPRERARAGPAEGSQDQHGGEQLKRRKRSVIAPRAAEVISAYVASAELAAQAPPPLWGADLGCLYAHRVPQGQYNPADANWRVRTSDRPY